MARFGMVIVAILMGNYAIDVPLLINILGGVIFFNVHVTFWVVSFSVDIILHLKVRIGR